jgi:hypothetical protein
VRLASGVGPRRFFKEEDQEASVVGVPAFLTQPHFGEGGLTTLRAENLQDVLQHVDPQLAEASPACERNPVRSGGNAK